MRHGANPILTAVVSLPTPIR